MVSNLAGQQTLATAISGVGSLVKAGSGTLTLTQANSYSGGTTITAGTLQLGNGNSGNDGSLVGVGGVNDNATLAFNLFGSQYYPDNISGSGSFIKTGSGSLTLAGTNNTYTGGTTVSGGILEVTSTSALPSYSTASKITIGNGGTLVLSVGGSGGWTTNNLGSLLTANSSGFASGSMLGIDTSAASSGVSYAGTISGSFGLAKFGANTLTLTGSNTYSGGTTIAGGTLQLGDGTSGHDGSVSASGSIADNGVLLYNLFGSQTYAGAISGAGNLTKSGSSSILTLTGSNSFSGTTTISGGTLHLSNGAALLGSTLVAPPSGSLVFDHSVSSHAFSVGGLSGTANISLQDNGSSPITFSVGGNGGSTVYSGVLGGSGSLVKIGTGNLTFTATQTFSGNTTITSGAIQLGDGTNGHDASLASNSISDNGMLIFSPYGSQTYGGVISGSGGLTKAGLGVLTLTGSDSYSGGTTVTSGSLIVASSVSLTSATGKNLTVGLNGPATLTVQNNASVSVGGELDVNYQATASGITANLSLQGGTLSVTGPMVVGRARMDTSPADTSALLTQTGGLLMASGSMTIGQLGLAQSIYNASGGRLTASSGLRVVLRATAC